LPVCHQRERIEVIQVTVGSDKLWRNSRLASILLHRLNADGCLVPNHSPLDLQEIAQEKQQDAPPGNLLARKNYLRGRKIGWAARDVELRQYVAGQSLRSVAAFSNLRRFATSTFLAGTKLKSWTREASAIGGRRPEHGPSHPGAQDACTAAQRSSAIFAIPNAR